MTRTPTQHFSMRSASTPEKGKQWYRIENAITMKSKSDDGADESLVHVYIYDEIGESWWGGISADQFVKDFADIEADQIIVHINSPGGQIFDGIAIHNAIKQHPASVETRVDALGASAASFIAQAGVKRTIHANGTLMIHDGLAMAYGNEADMLKTAGIIGGLSNTIAGIYARASGKLDTEGWRALMREEVWYNAEEALEAGLVDEIIEEVNTDAEDAKNRWDLTVFNHAGRNDAPSPKKIVKQITNRAKEADVAPKNSEGGGVEEPVTPDPDTSTEPETPEAPAGAGAEGDTTPEGATDKTSVIPENKVGSTTTFMVNGVATTDMRAVQAHITALETSAKESRETAIKNFVKMLAESNKISAADMDETETFALALSSDQYDAWQKLMSNSQPNALFARHGQQDPTATAATRSQEFTDDEEIENLRAIVKHNKDGGMSQEDLENTSSFKKLQALLKDKESKA